MIDNGYKCHSLIIEVKQNSGGLKNADIRSRERLVAPHMRRTVGNRTEDSPSKRG